VNSGLRRRLRKAYRTSDAIRLMRLPANTTNRGKSYQKNVEGVIDGLFERIDASGAKSLKFESPM
jgi:hypothetical protein